MSKVQRALIGVAALLFLGLGGCGFEGAAWWAKAQGIAFDTTGHACRHSQLKDGVCQAAAQQESKP